jgi:hypothetical protein
MPKHILSRYEVVSDRGFESGFRTKADAQKWISRSAKQRGLSKSSFRIEKQEGTVYYGPRSNPRPNSRVTVTVKDLRRIYAAGKRKSRVRVKVRAASSTTRRPKRKNRKRTVNRRRTTANRKRRTRR